MRYFVWIFRATLFLILLGFALRNDEPVVVRYFFGYEWHASLVLVLLLFFAIGTAIGVLSTLTTLLRQRKEISTLRNELRLKHESKE